MPIKTCIGCVNLRVRTEHDSSDITMGQGFVMFCELVYSNPPIGFFMVGTDTEREEFEANLRTAETCLKFELRGDK